MDAPPSTSLQPFNPPTEPCYADDVASSVPAAEFRPITAPVTGKSTSSVTVRRRKKMKSAIVDPPDRHSSAASSSSSSCSRATLLRHSIRSGHRVPPTSRRKPRVLIGSGRRKGIDAEALALPLGMSIAAVIAKVLERNEATNERISVDHLSEMCTLAVRESLTNVFGDRSEFFAKNFEKSFQSTLMTLRLISEASSNKDEHLRPITAGNLLNESIPSMLNRVADLRCNDGNDCHREPFLQRARCREQQSSLEETQESFSQTAWSEVLQSSPEEIQENGESCSMNRQLVLCQGEIQQQLTNVSPSQGTIQSTIEKSVIEQKRSNDLKAFEIGLTMRKLQLKERQLALHSDANFLERFKLSFGFSKASFKAERYKTQLEDTGNAELLRSCMDCLVAGLFIMMACLGYATYVYSHRRITEATASCTIKMESKSSWWSNPMASFNSGFQIVKCQLLVVSRMFFGILMILAIAYLLLQRSSTSGQAMPITFILLLLGAGCGIAGKYCIDTLGGSGYHWLLYWELLCSLHFFATVFTPTLFLALYGPIKVSEKTNSNSIFPYWMRRCLFYGAILVFLPLLCGLMPFAGPMEWRDHFSSAVMDLLLTEID